MKLEFELLGVLERLAGAPTLSVEIGDGLTVADALEQLAQAHPSLRTELESCAVANGEQLVRRRDTVSSGATLALLPPVAGG